LLWPDGNRLSLECLPMRNAHARLIATAGIIIAGAVLCTAPYERAVDVGKVLLPLAGIVWVIEFLAMVAVGDPRAPRQG
jgi:hypothetical protein